MIGHANIRERKAIAKQKREALDATIIALLKEALQLLVCLCGGSQGRGRHLDREVTSLRGDGQVGKQQSLRAEKPFIHNWIKPPRTQNILLWQHALWGHLGVLGTIS
jgi:hypothetical protein